MGEAERLGATLLADGRCRFVVWAPLAMFPYFLIYALDLKRNGYRMVDLFAVSSLNLLLMPVNFAGILASIGQIVTGRKGAFARTPKVVGRTRVLARYIVFNLAMPCLLATYVVSGLAEGEVLGSVMQARGRTLSFDVLAERIGSDALRPNRLIDVALYQARRIFAASPYPCPVERIRGEGLRWTFSAR